MTPRHRVYLSYHHDDDGAYRDVFEARLRDAYHHPLPSSKTLALDPTLCTETLRQKIRNEHLRDTSVTVVLIGLRTCQSKHVDWEIASSIRDTELGPRSGLLGILLPTHPAFGGSHYDPTTIPARLQDNLARGFATLRSWSDDPVLVGEWIHLAYVHAKRLHPINSRPPLGRTDSGPWLD
ncbi:MAG TPA: TIR domain-containing protein [Kofleriaceae bacterium]|nr:TIR domain-containing protein [Kofleriaceae bacterium]